MNISKIAHARAKGNYLEEAEYHHYIAVDWSERIMAIARTTNPQREPQMIERPANLTELKEYLAGLKGRTILTIEETTTAHWLFVELHDMVDRIIICDPFHNRLLVHGPKTDKIDARKLCLLLCGGFLKEIYHTSNELYELRRLVSGYDDLVRAGVRVLSQESALERAAGGACQAAGRFAPFVDQHLKESIELYQRWKLAYEKQFEQLCRRNKLLRAQITIDGIGVIGAVKILAYVVDARRFGHAGQYLSYCGLVKLEKISGGRSYGRRKSRYNHLLKAVYKTAAMAAIAGANPIREYYDYLLGKGIAEHNARHAVARYLARVSYGMLKHGHSFEPYRWKRSETANT